MATTRNLPRPAAAKYNPTGQIVDIISTVNGGVDTSWTIHQAGGIVGMESKNNRPPDEIPVDFVDWPFSKDGEHSFEDHLQMVKEEQPMYAVAPDIEGNIGLSKGLEYADRLSEHASVVIVVPKDVKPISVGDEYRIGIPCQEKFGGTPHNVWEYRDCEQVHLLGGSPLAQQKYAHYVNVKSLDTASIIKAAQLGSGWDDGGWKDVDLGFYGTLEYSIESLIQQWNGELTTFAIERIESLDRPAEPENTYEKLSAEEIPTRWLEIEYRSELEAIEDRIKPEDNPFPPSDLLGPGDKVPFPGRAAFYKAQ